MTAQSERREGGCLCGAVRYEVTGEPLWVAHCHCKSCRRHTGTAMTTFAGFLKPRFEIIAGDPIAYASSPGVRRQSCGNCGTPLTYEAVHCDDETHIYLATLDAPDVFSPTLHVFTNDAMPWLHVADDLPRYETTSRDSGEADGAPA